MSCHIILTFTTVHVHYIGLVIKARTIPTKENNNRPDNNSKHLGEVKKSQQGTANLVEGSDGEGASQSADDDGRRNQQQLTVAEQVQRRQRLVSDGLCRTTP